MRFILFAFVFCGCQNVAPTPTVTVDPVDRGSAVLSALAIAELPLSPAFSPDVHDYAVRCAAGTNALTLTATAVEGTTLTLSSAPLLSANPTVVEAKENDAITVEARDASGENGAYFIRCLPHDFPMLRWHRMGETPDGLYLLGNTVVGAGGAGFVMVLDARGTPVWYRRTGVGGGYLTALDTDTLGYSSVLGATYGTDTNGGFEILALADGSTTSLATTLGPTDHHELARNEQGNYLLLSYPRTRGIDLGTRGLGIADVADCRVEELAPNGTRISSWLASEHFDLATESTFLDVTAGATMVDGFHCNSIDPLPNGDLLLSLRHLDAVARIEKSTGKVLWKLGGVGSNKDGARILTLEGAPFRRQHDARILPSGELSLFDNHGPDSGPARAMRIALDMEAGTAKTTWLFAGSASSGAMGSYRESVDGSRVIGWGYLGERPAIAFTELDAGGEPALELWMDSGDHAYRVVKVPPGKLDVELLRRAVR